MDRKEDRVAASPGRTRRSGRSAGQALVEFALILPIIVMLTAGLIDGARAILAYNTVSNAAREGARFGIVLSDPAWGDMDFSKPGNHPGTYDAAAIAACLADGDPDTIVDQVMSRSVALDPTRTTIEIEAGVIRGVAWPSAVRVTVIYEFTPIVFYALGQSGFDVVGSSEMIVEY
jgi:hypothetical protein